MKILITGDLVINRVYSKSDIDDSLISLFKQGDISIVNLEAPITNSFSKILKTGPNLKANKKSTLEVFKALDIDIVTLANNHVLDYNEQGVSDSLAFCKEYNIQTVGAGMTVNKASETLYIDTCEGKVAIVNFAENEWASATEKSAGAHPMDIIDNTTQIKKAKEKARFVFVIIHGGHEFYNLPSPRMQKQYRFYAEQGADIIVGHHPHCISGNELYNGVPIYYSLGNFLFTMNSIYEDWYRGLVLEVEICKGKLRTRLHPIEQKKDSFKLNLLKGNEKQNVIDRVSSYSSIIVEEEKIKREWNKYVKSKCNIYLNYWSPISFISNRYIKKILSILRIDFITKKGLALKLNLLRCEAHADLSKEVVSKSLLSNKD